MQEISTRCNHALENLRRVVEMMSTDPALFGFLWHGSFRVSINQFDGLLNHRFQLLLTGIDLSRCTLTNYKLRVVFRKIEIQEFLGYKRNIGS
jgi:hypothetical protein